MPIFPENDPRTQMIHEEEEHIREHLEEYKEAFDRNVERLQKSNIQVTVTPEQKEAYFSDERIHLAAVTRMYRKMAKEMNQEKVPGIFHRDQAGYYGIMGKQDPATGKEKITEILNGNSPEARDKRTGMILDKMNAVLDLDAQKLAPETDFTESARYVTEHLDDLQFAWNSQFFAEHMDDGLNMGFADDSTRKLVTDRGIYLGPAGNMIADLMASDSFFTTPFEQIPKEAITKIYGVEGMMTREYDPLRNYVGRFARKKECPNAGDRRLDEWDLVSTDLTQELSPNSVENLASSMEGLAGRLSKQNGIFSWNNSSQFKDLTRALEEFDKAVKEGRTADYKENLRVLKESAEAYQSHVPTDEEGNPAPKNDRQQERYNIAGDVLKTIENFRKESAKEQIKNRRDRKVRETAGITEGMVHVGKAAEAIAKDTASGSKTWEAVKTAAQNLSEMNQNPPADSKEYLQQLQAQQKAFDDYLSTHQGKRRTENGARRVEAVGRMQKALEERISEVQAKRKEEQSARMDAGLTLDNSITAKAQTLLNERFGAAEQVGKRISRLDLIMIDGKPMSALIREQFDRSGGMKLYPELSSSNGKIDKYFAEHKQDAARYVAAAVMAGKNVQIFDIDKNGRVKDQPQTVKESDLYQGRQLDAVKKAAAAEVKKLGMEENLSPEAINKRSRETQLIINVHNFQNAAYHTEEIGIIAAKKTAMDWLKDHKDRLKENEPLDNTFVAVRNEAGLSIGRENIFSFTTGLLLRNPKLSIQDILDPEKLQEQKKEIVGKVMDAITETPVDREKLAELHLQARQGLYNFINQNLKDADLNDYTKVYSNKMLNTMVAEKAFFDLDQNRIRLKEKNTLEHDYDQDQPEMQYLIKQGKTSDQAENICRRLHDSANNFSGILGMAYGFEQQITATAMGYKPDASGSVAPLTVPEVRKVLQEVKTASPDDFLMKLDAGSDGAPLAGSMRVYFGNSPILKNAGKVSGTKSMEFGRSAFCGKIRRDAVFERTEDGLITVNLKTLDKKQEKVMDAPVKQGSPKTKSLN